MALLSKSTFVGLPVDVRAPVARPVPARASVIVRAEAQVPRRSALGLLAGAAALLTGANPSAAAYGEGAKIFGKQPTNKSGFVPYQGEGYAFLLPSKWIPSKQRDYPGVDIRWMDNMNGEANNVVVIKKPAGADKIGSLGSPEKFIQENISLLGESVFQGMTRSEGGFAPGKVSSASLLDAESVTDKNGKQYYKYHILTRTADGTEGGHHYLVAAAVSGGQLYLLSTKVGDKRWNRGIKKEAEGIWNSFTVA